VSKSVFEWYKIIIFQLKNENPIYIVNWYADDLAINIYDCTICTKDNIPH